MQSAHHAEYARMPRDIRTYTTCNTTVHQLANDSKSKAPAHLQPRFSRKHAISSPAHLPQQHMIPLSTHGQQQPHRRHSTAGSNICPQPTRRQRQQLPYLYTHHPATAAMQCHTLGTHVCRHPSSAQTHIRATSQNAAHSSHSHKTSM